jgi:hypothetical protein
VWHFEFKAISLNSCHSLLSSNQTFFKSGKKFRDLHLAVPFVEVVPDDDDNGPKQVTLKVSIDPSLDDEWSNFDDQSQDGHA